MQKMRGFKLKNAFYEEIVNAVSMGAMSTVETVGAAQALMECSRKDYIDESFGTLDADQDAGSLGSGLITRIGQLRRERLQT